MSLTTAYPPGFTGFFTDFPKDPASARAFLGAFPFPGGLTAKGTFTKDTANAWTVEGNIEFTQNIFSGYNSRYTAHLRGHGMEGKNYEIGLADDCAGTNYLVSPSFYIEFVL